MELHEKLKYLRTTKNLTQKTVATKVGLNVRQYQRYENGDQNPTTNVLSRLCHYFRVPSGYFLESESSHNKKETLTFNVNAPNYIDLLHEMYQTEQQFFNLLGIDDLIEPSNELFQEIQSVRKIFQELDKKIEQLRCMRSALMNNQELKNNNYNHERK